jgi:glycosyltransferase involved in cell wall biosynthesis
MGLPVVVGNNPSMKELVEKYGFGVSIDDDGKDIKKISDGIEQVMSNYDYYIKNNKLNRDKLLWKEQENVIAEIVDCLLK